MSSLTESDIRNILMRVENPGRYAGGEYGSHDKKYGQAILKMAMSYPDMYDIGMANNAIKILYNLFNSIDNVICDRVFAPALDFEKILKESSLPLFTLENNIPLCDLDILGFTFGYELTATNLLNILSLGKIPLFNSERDKNHPVIIAGGPGITNPVPYGDFIDLFFMGEAEEEFEKLLCKAVELKKAGAGRDDIFLLMAKSENIWHKGKKEKVYKAVYKKFPEEYAKRKYNLVPSVKPVQDNGVVEIMRGCPNGCRFCHAGFYYRPKREKDYKIIDREIEELVFECGYREITLSSLSSGDYSSLSDTIKKLNKKYSGVGVSFSFPSLKISSFTISLLSEIGEVRKSGLTFAVETPDPSSQRGLNKEIDIDQTIAIIKEAKQLGWKNAKFYFMIGLPDVFKDSNDSKDFNNSNDSNNSNHEELYYEESDNIINFLFKIQGATGIDINVNIGTFVPKPHTPYQWAAQMEEETAMKQIHYIKNRLKGKNIKVGYHSPMMSFVEGIFSRGDERAGKLLFDAWQAGAKFDAWEDYFDIALWKKIIGSQSWNVEEETSRKRDTAEKFPWLGISMGISEKYLLDEYNKSCNYELTSKCETTCTHNCGVCGNSNGIVNSETAGEDDVVYKLGTGEERYRVIFSFLKKGKQIYLGHLDVMRLFEKAFQRSRLGVRFTEGFNPKPRLEFANPLTLGIESEGEIASIETYMEYGKDEFITKLNNALPDGIKIIDLFSHKINIGDKKTSLMSIYSGSVYRIYFPKDKNYLNLLKEYICKNSLEGFVKLEELDSCDVSANGIEASCFCIRLWVTVKPGSKSLFKILKEAFSMENPLAEVIVIREEVFAGENLSNYLSFFRKI